MDNTQQGKVKSVLSGDTVILTSVQNPNAERTLSLAFVTAPRLRREGDEVRFLDGHHALCKDPTLTLLRP